MPEHRKKWPAGKYPTRRWMVIQAVAWSELSEQCQLLLRACERLEEETASGPTGSPPRIGDWNRLVWLDVIGILAAYSAITHLIWPSPDHRRDKLGQDISRSRGAIVRKNLKIESEKPLISRAVRNAFEHTDERLDDWVLDQTWPDDIPPEVPTAWSASGYPAQREPSGYSLRAFRYVNYRTMNVRIGDEWVNLNDIRDFAKKVLSRIPTALHVQWGEAEFKAPDAGKGGPRD
jgi:hypothetical protein